MLESKIFKKNISKSKSHHGTDLARSSLKEIKNKNKYTLFTYFLEGYKAFGRMNLYELLGKLISRGVLKYIIATQYKNTL